MGVRIHIFMFDDFLSQVFSLVLKCRHDTERNEDAITTLRINKSLQGENGICMFVFIV